MEKCFSHLHVIFNGSTGWTNKDNLRNTFVCCLASNYFDHYPIECIFFSPFFSRNVPTYLPSLKIVA